MFDRPFRFPLVPCPPSASRLPVFRLPASRPAPETAYCLIKSTYFLRILKAESTHS